MTTALSPLSNSEKAAWLRLSRTSTIGPVAFRGLLERFGTAQAALDALPELAARSARKRRMKIPSLDSIEHEIEQMFQRNISLFCHCEPQYPALLRAIDPPPPLISVIGDVNTLHRPCLAIIGSRNASANGLAFARQLAHELGQQGFVIVSGLARGMDASAHWGAIETGTIAVLGGGVDHVYPSQNTELYHAIAEKGAIVSESPLGYRATARDFPRRNRIISGLCLGVIVIEAAEKSGTLITARFAMEQNREVMAAPGSPLDPRTKGCNRLIRQGAALIENTQDVLDVVENLSLNHPSSTLSEPAGPEKDTLKVKDTFKVKDTGQVEEPSQTYAPPITITSTDLSDHSNITIDDAKQHLLALCSASPANRDEIIRQSAVPYPIASAALLELEIFGEILVEPDGRLSLNFS